MLPHLLQISSIKTLVSSYSSILLSILTILPNPYNLIINYYTFSYLDQMTFYHLQSTLCSNLWNLHIDHLLFTKFQQITLIQKQKSINLPFYIHSNYAVMTKNSKRTNHKLLLFQQKKPIKTHPLWLELEPLIQNT